VKIWLKFQITFAIAEFQYVRYYWYKFSAPVPNNCYLHGTPRPSRVHPIKVGSELAASSIRNPFQASLPVKAAPGPNGEEYYYYYYYYDDEDEGAADE